MSSPSSQGKDQDRTTPHMYYTYTSLQLVRNHMNGWLSDAASRALCDSDLESAVLPELGGTSMYKYTPRE